MDDHVEVLERAIRDTGCWRWWDETLPDAFQIEFGLVKLLNSPSKPGGPPSSLLALRFGRPRAVAFVTRTGAPRRLARNWPRLLHDDKLGSFGVDQEAFSFSHAETFRRVLESARRIETVHGSEPTLESLASAPCRLAFLAGAIGLVVAADEMVALSHEGELSPTEILRRNQRWWAYWRDYWKRKDSAAPLPYDATCEVTIPAGEG